MVRVHHWANSAQLAWFPRTIGYGVIEHLGGPKAWVRRALRHDHFANTGWVHPVATPREGPVWRTWIAIEISDQCVARTDVPGYLTKHPRAVRATIGNCMEIQYRHGFSHAAKPNT